MGDLKGSQHPLCKQLMRGKACDIGLCHFYNTRGRWEHPRNHVEQSGFARPVGTDKARNGPLFYFKRGSIDGAKAPKMLVYIFNFNHCALRFRF